MVNPTSGKAGDIIAFTGGNWLPQGIPVKLTLLVGGVSSPLLDTPLPSDKKGTITGAFHLPTDLDPTQTTGAIIASDATGALHAQTSMILLGPSPTPNPTVEVTPTPVPTAKPTVSTIGVASDTSRSPFPLLDAASVILILLIVGGTLGVAALMLILFLIPWGERYE
jgi:hypothetical protein